MIDHHELMAAAHRNLKQRKKESTGISGRFKRSAVHRTVPVPGGFSISSVGYIGPRPAAFVKPKYGTPAYAIALKVGWIAPEEEAADRAAWAERRKRSLQTCHRYTLYQRRRHKPPKDTGAYVPELSARVVNDRNLTDGAVRCAQKIAELVYRQNRNGRVVTIRVAYLMKALGRSRRTVQRYLRQLEREGYISSDVVKSSFAKMCVGLAVSIARPLLARHHREEWPVKKRGNPGVSPVPQNRPRFLLLPVDMWALKCMDGVWRSNMKTAPLFNHVLSR